MKHRSRLVPLLLVLGAGVINRDAVYVRKSTGSGFSATLRWTGEMFQVDLRTFFAGVTGDCRADAVAVGYDKVRVRRSVSHAFAPAESWTINPFYGNKATAFADVSGDGKAGAIAVNTDRITVRPAY